MEDVLGDNPSSDNERAFTTHEKQTICFMCDKCDTYVVKNYDVNRLKHPERNMERWMYNTALRDDPTSEKLRSKLGTEYLGKVTRFCGCGHLEKKDKNN